MRDMKILKNYSLNKTNLLLKGLGLLFFTTLLLSSCNKEEEPIMGAGAYQPPPPPPPPAPPTLPFHCGSRQVINVNLESVGTLSTGRVLLKSGAAGSKILFAGGWTPGVHSSRVDIYDTITKTWFTAELTEPLRDGMAVASVGEKVFFAGGSDYDWIDVTSRVDIYNATTNEWSTAELSVPRHDLAAVTLGNKIYFAGGAVWKNIRQGSDVIDIYDNETDTWTTDKLSEGRYELTATPVGNKIYFAGGINDMYSISNKIDVFDSGTNTWSTSQLNEPKTGHAAVSINNKIFWAGGAKTSYQSGYTRSDVVEIKDAITGLSTLDCITAKARFNVVIKNNNLVFFTGIDQSSQIDIYNITDNTWSVGVLPFSLNASAIICVNNSIYVAGGYVNGGYSNQVWKLEF